MRRMPLSRPSGSTTPVTGANVLVAYYVGETAVRMEAKDDDDLRAYTLQMLSTMYGERVVSDERTRVRRESVVQRRVCVQAPLWPSAPPRSIAPSSHARRGHFCSRASDEPRKWRRRKGRLCIHRMRLPVGAVQQRRRAGYSGSVIVAAARSASQVGALLVSDSCVSEQ